MLQPCIIHPLIGFLVVLHKIDGLSWDHKSFRNNESIESVIQASFILLQAFQKEDIDPLQTQLHDINSVGQGLIQTAASGASTKKLEDDLEEVNAKWNTLNKKVPPPI